MIVARKSRWIRVTGLPHGYNSKSSVLLCGEGNFSFALPALVTLFDGDGSNILATSLDARMMLSLRILTCKIWVKIVLRLLFVTVHFSVDVNDNKNLHRIVKQWSAPENNERCRRNTGYATISLWRFR